jgi:hypothetical protein
MSPCFLTTFVLIVEFTKGERLSKWRKRNKSSEMILGEGAR